MRSKQDEFLDQQVKVVVRRLKPLLKQCQSKIGYLCINPLKEDRIVLKLWYFYDEKIHGDRSFTQDVAPPKLARLKVSEANVLGQIVADVIGDDFDAEFVGMSRIEGKVEYSLVPKNMG